MNEHIIYSFDGLRLDPAKRELWRGNQPVPVQPKAFDCIAYLIEHRNRAVGKDELIAAVWGRVDATDRVLGLAMSRARQALGDTGEEHRIIRTITRVGYSWVMPVDEVEIPLPGDGQVQADHAHADGNHATRDTPLAADSGNLDAGAARAATKSRFHSSWRRLSLASLVTVLLVAATYAIVHHYTQPSKPIEGETAVVLPVVVVGDNSTWIRLGVMDLIAERLRAAGQSVVPSENTVVLARRLNENSLPTLAELQAITEATTATLVMNAEAERINDHWRITLRTIHGRDQQLVAQSDGDDILITARAVADQMAYALGYLLPKDDALDNDQALAQLLQRMRAAGLSANYDDVRRLFTDAPPVHQAHPRVRIHLAGTEWRTGRFEEARAAFSSLVEEVSAEEDPVLHAQVRYGLGFSHFGGETDLAIAEHNLDEAIRLTESIDTFEARRVLGSALGLRGGVHGLRNEHAEALSDFARARFALQSTANQLGLIVLDNNLAIVHGLARRYDEVVSYADRAVEGARRFQDPVGELRARNTLNTAKLHMLDPGAVLADEPRLHELLPLAKNPSLDVNVKLTLIEALIDTGQWGRAEAMIVQLLVRDDAGQVPEREPMARALAARLAWRKDRVASAAREAALSLQHPWWGSESVTGTNHHARARLYLIQLRAIPQRGTAGAGADSIVAAGTTWASSSDDPVVKTYMDLLQAEHAADLGDSEAAASIFERAFAQAEASRAPYLLLEVAQSYALWLLGQGRTGQAAIVAGRVAGWADQHYDAALLQLRIHHALGDTAPWRSTLDTVRDLAGEREVPAALLSPPVRPRA